MLVVTGGIACGKSTFVEAAREVGFHVVDADEWYHNEYVGSSSFVLVTNILFGKTSVKDAAFRSRNWEAYERLVVGAFCRYVKDIAPYFCIIPEFFKKEDFFRALLNITGVLTIERTDNISAALDRDGHRTAAETERIAGNQTTSERRVELSDHVLYNVGSRDEFKEECTFWLKSHLLEVFTHPTKAIST